ncbi:MAG: NADH-quinone oxidoreductase subunit NuoH [Bacteroidales bacterium]|nr:NADH-quinone oxidoreductase subunit NuoH [Bacteroidales bacterium]HNW72882.1 NADH-quinone oxidoreductase subunit NuoH [Bacteroidales bacterium]HPS50589.1 NADH-quinone oxidoreductase subunit NuoH [Bacteroidales bacterium]
MLTTIIYKTILASFILILSLVVAMYSTLVERKVAGWFQDRHGPNRAGPWGLLQPLADGIKLFFKEEFMPQTADKFLYILGPSLTMLIACLTSAVIPWGPDIVVADQSYPLQVADINIGILYIFAILSIGVYGIMIGGWSSNNKYALLGSVRASSQMISYELAMSLAIITIVMMTGSLSLREIVAQQQGFNWNIFYQPLGFLIFLICAFAETNRAPFDLPECETELVGGYHTEYSSMKLGFYLFAEYINMFISGAVMATLFLGGYHFPGLDQLGLSPNVFAFVSFMVLFTKITIFGFLFMWIRWTLPRFRYDQLMKLGWKSLIPLAIFNVLITGIVILISR